MIECRKIRRLRNSGSMLLELLVAIVVAGILAISLCQSLSQTKDASFGAHGRVICASVAQAVAERLRSMPYDSLPTVGTTLPIQVYSDVSVAPLTNPSIQQPALLMDITNSTWSDKSRQDRLDLDSSVAFSPGPAAGTLLATISVTASGVRSSYSSSILLTRYGVQGQ